MQAAHERRSPRYLAPVRVIFLILGTLWAAFGAAQSRDNELRIAAGLHLGMDRARIVTNGPAPFTTNPWLANTLDLGVSFVHLNRWGIGLMGGVAANGYTYKLDRERYDLYHITQRAELQFHWMMRAGSMGAGYYRFGTGLGLSFQGNGGISSHERIFTATSTAPSRSSAYFAPEITLFKPIRAHSIEIGIRYLRHFVRSPASYTTLRSGSSTTTATTSNDHAGLVFRYHLGRKRKTPSIRSVPGIAYEERRTNILTTLNTAHDRIMIELWDNAEFDGDSITVVFNNEVVLAAYELTKKKKRLEIAIPYGINTLLVVARNEGRVPPNTASCIVRHGKRKEELLIRTSYEMNTGIEIIRE